MVKKEVELLNNQIEKLNLKGFEFEAWKKYSLLLLTRIFGEDDLKVTQLQKIDFEFNSWSLRDASGNESYEEGSKRLAKEVLQSAIDELNIYGLPNSIVPEDKVAKEILSIILDEFKGSRVKEIQKILKSNDSLAEKNRKIKELIEELGENTTIDIITNILSNPSLLSIIA